jgi:hypothetical protein
MSNVQRGYEAPHQAAFESLGPTFHIISYATFNSTFLDLTTNAIVIWPEPEQRIETTIQRSGPGQTHQRSAANLALACRTGPASQVCPCRLKRLNPATLLPNHTTLYSLNIANHTCKRSTLGSQVILRISAVFYTSLNVLPAWERAGNQEIKNAAPGMDLVVGNSTCSCFPSSLPGTQRLPRTLLYWILLRNTSSGNMTLSLCSSVL